MIYKCHKTSLVRVLGKLDSLLVVIYTVKIKYTKLNEKKTPDEYCIDIYKEMLNTDNVDIKSLIAIVNIPSMKSYVIIDVYRSLNRGLSLVEFVNYLKELDEICLYKLREDNARMVISNVVGFNIPK